MAVDPRAQRSPHDPRSIAGRARRSWTRARYRLLLDDALGGRERCMLLAGTARSGTTWASAAIASQLQCRVLFEPFQPHKVRAYRQFEYFQYRRPTDEDPALAAFCAEVFSGRIRGRWIDQEPGPLRPRLRLVKDIRANLLLGWIARHFPEVPRLFILRHPLAVVRSRLQLGWATDDDLASFLRQPGLVEDYLADRLDLIRATRSEPGKHALVWCISNLVPLRQFRDGGLPVVCYEHLRDRPEIEVPRMFAALGQPHDASVYETLRVPSSTTRAPRAADAGTAGVAARGAAGDLTAEQVAEILEIVAAFGLGHLYGAAPTPLVGPGAAVTA